MKKHQTFGLAERTHLGTVCIQSSIIYIHGEVDAARKGQVLRGGADSRIGKEENHSSQGTDCHGISPTQQLGVAHETGQDRTEDAHSVGDHVVSPGIVGTVLAGLGAAGRKILRQEDVKERICQTDEGPG